MTSFEVGLMMGAAIGLCLACAVIVVINWWLDHRIEKVELDDTWIRFTKEIGQPIEELEKRPGRIP